VFPQIQKENRFKNNFSGALSFLLSDIVLLQLVDELIAR
jgi:hypothetical protein